MNRLNVTRWWLVALCAALALFLAACGADDPMNNGPANNQNNANNVVPDGGATNNVNNQNNVNNGSDMGSDMEEPSCMDDCAPGSQTCDEEGGYRVCGQYDADECYEFSPPIACAEGFSCEVDRCVPPCRDECPVGGAICEDDDTVQVCGNFDSDLCREPGASIDCAAGERCEQGACVDESVACQDECTMGDDVCFGDAVRTCGDFDSDPCLDLGAPVACSLGQVCSAGACVPFCQDECSTDGETACFGDAVRTCGDEDQDGCLEWSVATACQGGTTCSSGACVETCTDECSASGQAVCSPDAKGVSFCGDYDSDICLDRTSVIPCPQGFGCSNGVCVATCTNECQLGSGAQCGMDGTSLETCGDFDSDPCYELGGNVMCPGGASCSAGACDIPCTDECTTNGASECTMAGDATRTCGQWDLDSCLEWSAPTSCEAWEICGAGACELGQTPATIVVNEVLFDSVGGDTNQDNLLFVELWGPAGTSLDGWSVVGVNGTGGSDYNSIDLSGETIPSDGYFVIAHPNGASEVVNQADITDANVDFQNGPDSVQLRWRGRVVDAVGYGSFGGADVFAGEGSAAAKPAAGESLSRDMNHTDTDDNSADFSVLAVPTPREMTATCMDDCAMGETRCDAGEIQYCVANADADPCLEFGPSMVCPNAGETCVANVCQAPCSDECPSMGDTQCLGTDVSTCGNYDGDSCLEWSQASTCPGTESCVVDSCQDPTAPEVVLISPQGTSQTTQGNQHRMLVDVTPSAGRTVSTVRYFANGTEFATTTSVPHEAFYTVPANTPTNSTISLQATAEDSSGIVGSSAYAYLDVKNDTPVADFTATITNTTTVTVDAGASSDTETAIGDLEVCWDWNNDGTCDTAYSTNKVASHDFGASGTYTVRMEVRDEVGQTHSATRQVSFADIQYIGGQSVTTTLWYGTIIVTGDVTVPAGETLTIAPGTNVLFVFADVDSDGVGDYRLTVEGELVVNGSVSDPVVFTGQSQTAKIPGGWDRIVINGSTPSTINHAIFEYGFVGLEIFNGSTLDNVEVRSTKATCIVLDNADNATVDNTNVHDCGANGVEVKNGSTTVSMDNLSSESNVESGVRIRQASGVDITNSLLASNGEHGVRVEASTLDLSDSTTEDNTGRGLLYEGSSGGLATHNQIRNNGAEGVGFVDDLSGDSPAPVVQYNNIYSNALTGSAVTVLHDTASSLSASYGCCSSTGSTSSVWTAPAGEEVRRVYVSFDEYYLNVSIDGYLQDQSGSILQSFETDFNGWVDVPPGVTGLTVRVRDSGRSSTTDTITASRVETIRYDGSADVSAGNQAKTIDVRYNYLGTFPYVLNRVDMSRTNALDLQGFIGSAFGSSWDTGIYKAGEVGGQSWSGTIIITGNVSVAADSNLDIAAGTVVEFVDHDQDLDLEGDWTLTANGALNVNGAVGNEVVFKGHGAATPDMYQTIRLLGGTNNSSTWTDVTMRNAVTGLVLNGPHMITRADVQSDIGNGIEVYGSLSPRLDDCSIHDGMGDGLYISGTTNVDVDRIDIRNNAGRGVYIEGGSGAVIEDSTIRDNDSHGIQIVKSSPSVNYNLLTYNGGNGIFVIDDSSPTTAYNIIKFNDDAGVSVWEGTSNNSPTPTINYSNIYGNSVAGSTVGLSYSTASTLSASYGCCSSTGSTSSMWTAPAGEEVRRVYVSFDEYYVNVSIDGYLQDQNGLIIRSFENDFNGWVMVPAGVTGLTVRVRDSGRSSTTDTITASQVETTRVETTDVYELTCVTESGTTDAKFNYWTPSIGDVPSKIYEARAGSVDYTGFTGAEYPGGTVMQVGPRP